MTVLVNGPDQPRVVFNYREPGARKKALVLTDHIPFGGTPKPTSDFFKNRTGCTVSTRSDGFTELANDEISYELDCPLWALPF